MEKTVNRISYGNMRIESVKFISNCDSPIIVYANNESRNIKPMYYKYEALNLDMTQSISTNKTTS